MLVQDPGGGGLVVLLVVMALSIGCYLCVREAHPTRQAVRAQPEAYIKVLVICPYCGVKAEQGTLFCPRCGGKL